MDESLYCYRATVVAVYDGDTIRCDIDLGFHCWIKSERLRLARIDAPEIRGEDRAKGLITRGWLRQKLLGKTVIIQTLRDRQGKYGRFLAEVILDGVNINDQLVAEGLAVYRAY